MRKVVVEVRREHLERAQATRSEDLYGCHCPVALALTDAGLKNVRVGTAAMRAFGLNGYEGACDYALPPTVVRVVSLFDARRDSEILSLLPLQFEVEVPDAAGGAA